MVQSTGFGSGQYESTQPTGQLRVFGSVSGLGQRQSTSQWFGQFSQRKSTLVNQSTVGSTGQTQDAVKFKRREILFIYFVIMKNFSYTRPSSTRFD
ncbi:hypothetical protein HanRHA438_Chr15g0722421 [Helianthus annuus]|nr:hypothetical protein HanPSC8_Chr15g0681661 [Helianthus annuus]KAJ0846222.1 hypothetical protein HanRHA438_Chr15g0722421 [Helianthus annuus]